MYIRVPSSPKSIQVNALLALSSLGSLLTVHFITMAGQHFGFLQILTNKQTLGISELEHLAVCWQLNQLLIAEPGPQRAFAKASGPYCKHCLILNISGLLEVSFATAALRSLRCFW